MKEDTNTRKEDLVLTQPTELFEKAKEIAQDTKSSEKFPFALQYDANQKGFLLSMLKTAGAIIDDDDNANHIFSTKMNMVQLAFVKCLDCVERVKTDEGINPFLKEEAIQLTSVQQGQQESESLEGESEVIVTNINNEPSKVQSELTNRSTTDANLEIAINTERIQKNDSIAIASVGASPRSSCNNSSNNDCNGSCPTNTSMETAATISDESYTSGDIHCPGGEQWFKFVAQRTGLYTICTTGDLDTIGTLYNCHGYPLQEVDDYTPCGKINFRIIQNLVSGNTYYIKVRLHGNNTGRYILRVTERLLANYVTISKDNFTLKKGVTYELPITPNYIYKGYNGAQRIPELSIDINPTKTAEQRILWYELNDDVFNCSTGWDDDGNRYTHLTAINNGTAKLYAQDWHENGKRDECTITVVTPYCGGENHRDVTQHSMVWHADGYYVCSKCGYRIKSPELQDKDILSTDDYLKMIATMHYYTHNVLLARELPSSAYFYNAEARKCKIVMDTIRSQPQYSSLYEYQGPNNKYLANETNETTSSFVFKSTINTADLLSYNGFYETIASLVIGYYCPIIGTLNDVIELIEGMVSGKIDAINFGTFIAELLDLDDIAIALSLFSATSDIVNCDVVIGDPIVRISFSVYAGAEYVFDTNHNIKKVKIIYTT